ncbi:MAG: S-layer homology domain-containing protein [Clostridia bacterium]|nr:S-layer homology domain-containing protein [Clostridia bacterium]
MKKTKKLLAFLLAFVMLVSLAVAPVSAANFSDVPENHQYYDAIQSLVVRGIINGYEDGTFKPEATITRAEFCKIVIYAMNLQNMVSATVTETGFSDVAVDHWAAGNIKIARDMGIINGFDDGTFKPGENVTFEQAVKMVVCATSDQLATLSLNNGGYPDGYLKVAQSYGFLKNVTDGAKGTAAKRATIAKLIDNTLKADFSDLGTVNIGGGDRNSTGAGSSNQLTEVKGQVVTVYGASILSNSDSVPKKHIKLLLSNGDEEIYSVEDLSLSGSINDYLGKMVLAYYKYDSDADTQSLTNLTSQKGRNGEITVSMMDIDTNFTDEEITYYDDEDELELSIADDAIIMFNGRLSSSSFAELLEEHYDKPGSIRFLSDRSGGDATIVFFTVYENIYVSSVTSSTKTVYGEGGSKFVIDDEDKTKSVTILKDGKDASFSSIAKGQILSVSQSEDGKIVEALISTETVTGAVTGLTRDEKSLTIKGKTYKFAADVEMGEEIEVGANLKLYIDAFGKIAKYTFQATASNYTYAYLMQIEKFGNDFNPSIEMQIIPMNSSSVKETSYKLAETINLNNKSYKVASDFEDIKAVLREAAELYEYEGYELAEGEVYQPIKYALSNNQIKTILVGKPLAESTDADLKVDASSLESADGMKCTVSNTKLMGLYTLSSSTKVLRVPAADERDDFDKYTIKSGTASGFVRDKHYRVLLVDVKSNTPAMVIVYEAAGDSLNTSSSWTSNYPGVVTEKKSVVKNDVQYDQITVLNHSKETQYLTNQSDDFYDSVTIGDIIRVNDGPVPGLPGAEPADRFCGGYRRWCQLPAE